MVIALPIVTGVGLSFLVEQQLQPNVQPFWRRPPAAFALHIGLWLLLFGAELALFRRPWFAVANVLALQLLVVLVSNAKFQSLREPFIFQDFEYFRDTLKHPRLFLPFFGLGKALTAAIGYATALFVGLTFESSLTELAPTTDFVLVLSVLMVSGIVLLWLGKGKKLTLKFEPKTDLQQLGLVTCLWRYGEEEYDRCSPPACCDFVKPAQKTLGGLANLVVVQSESFFDVRDLFSGIRPEILGEFELLKTSAACFGKLAVPAWGANTVRTEFAFLSGLNGDKLGVHRFNPYRKLAQQGVPTLASFLRNLGYRTVCVHPYPASFYNRNKVFPQLGFDDFIDISSFSGVDKTGPYIGDVALAEKVCDLLESSSAQPIFVFVITMENHGPLHWEKVVKGDVERLYSKPPPEACDDLTIYLRHLHNADCMAGMLRDCLEALPGSNWLCWFGDHVPIMHKVYGALGVPEGQTDYLIWGKDDLPNDGARLDMAVENLASLLLTKMGLVSKSLRMSKGVY
ncbi:MAG: LTA synthase family protein [Desulfobulbaceae bacterium]|nr:LTA synthase family protein [Desulfobulbaceae bacterium]